MFDGTTFDTTPLLPCGRPSVARLQAALDGEVDLDHLQHARGQLVALRQLLLLVVELAVEHGPRLLERVLDRLELVGEVLVGRADVEPVVLLDAVEVRLVDHRALGDLVRAAVGGLAVQELGDPVERVGLDDPKLVVQVEAVALQLVVDDLLGALVALDPSRVFTCVDDRALRALVDAQRVSFTSSLSPNRAATSGVSVVSPLGVTLPTNTSPGCFGADVDDAGLVQVELLLARLGYRG